MKLLTKHEKCTVTLRKIGEKYCKEMMSLVTSRCVVSRCLALCATLLSLAQRCLPSKRKNVKLSFLPLQPYLPSRMTNDGFRS